MAEIPELSSRERQIMDVIYRLGEATARDIEREMTDDLANATIRTMLRILEQKGHLEHWENGRQFVYRPTLRKNEVAETAARRLVRVFFDGSVAQAVTGMLDIDDLNLSTNELDELSRRIAAARKQKEKQ